MAAVANTRHAGGALHSASSVDSGLLFATSFRRVVSARRHAERRQGALDSVVAEPCFLQRLYALVLSLFGRFRYPVIGSDDVVGVWVVAQVFDHVTGEGWREFVMSHETGKGPGLVAGEPLGTHPTPLDEELSYARVRVELQDEGPLRILVQSGSVQFCVYPLSGVVVERVQAGQCHGQHGVGTITGGIVWVNPVAGTRFLYIAGPRVRLGNRAGRRHRTAGVSGFRWCPAKIPWPALRLDF